MPLLRTLFHLWVLFASALAQGAQAVSTIALTPEEQAFIQAHPVIVLGGTTDFAPVTVLAEDGRIEGIAPDIAAMIEQRTGLKFRFELGVWKEVVRKAEAGITDGLSIAAASPERKAQFRLSRSYGTTSSVIVVKSGNPEGIESIIGLLGKRMAVQAGNTAMEQAARKIFATPVIRDTLPQMLQAVIAGKADFAIADENHLFIAARSGLGGFIEMAFPIGDPIPVSFALRKNWPELQSIVDKAMLDIGESELIRLKNKWLFKVVPDESPARRIVLSTGELGYLANKGKISMCVEPNRMPFHGFTQDGVHEGMVDDFMDLLSKRVGVELEHRHSKNWIDTLALAKTGQCDLIPLAMETPENRSFLTYTRAFLSYPLVLAARSDTMFVDKFEQVLDKPIAMVKGYAFTEQFKRRYPQARIVEVVDVDQAFELLRDKQVFGVVDALPTMVHGIQKGNLVDVKINGKFDQNWELSVATRNDEPLLHSIFQKAVDSLTAEDIRQIESHWVSYKVEQPFNYALFWQAGIAIGFLLAFVVFRNRSLTRFNREIQAKNALIEQQHKAVQGTLDQIATLLDNSGQGFLSFGPDLMVNEGYSRECLNIFNRNKLDLPLPELLAPRDPKQREFLVRILPLVMASGDDVLRREAFISLLPSEYQLDAGGQDDKAEQDSAGGRFFKAEYRLLNDGRMMLILTDITDEKILRERLAMERQRLEFVVNALEKRDDLLELLADFENFRSRVLPDLLSFERQGEVVLAELFRQIHTFKGLFAQASLPALPELLHKLETRLSHLREQGDQLDSLDIKRELGMYNLAEALERDLGVLREKLGKDYFNSERIIRLPSSALNTLEAEVCNVYGSGSRMHYLIQQLRYEPFQALIEPHFKSAEQLASRQDKYLAPIEYEGDDARVDPDRYGPFCKTLVHVFRNAVDHGIEDPDTRLMANKDETAILRCQVHTAADHLTLTIEDDGRGIDTERLRAKAVAKGLLDGGRASVMHHDEVLMLIFADGLSTREKVNTISGRGVGLSAVIHELNRLGGKVQVESTLGLGTRFIFTLPYRPVIKIGDQGTSVNLSTRLLAPLPRVMDSFCAEHLGLTVSVAPDSQVLALDAFHEFTAVVSLDSGLDATLGLSVEPALLHAMTRAFVPGITDAEVLALAESVGTEIVNTLVGSATVYYTYLTRHVVMGTPKVIPPEQRAAFIKGRLVQGFVGQAEAGRFILFCVLNQETLG